MQETRLNRMQARPRPGSARPAEAWRRASAVSRPQRPSSATAPGTRPRQETAMETFPSSFPFTKLPNTADDLRPLGAPDRQRQRERQANTSRADPVRSAGRLDHTVDWKEIADTERQIFRSSSLKLEAALNELNLMGSQVDSMSKVADVSQTMDSRGPHPFRTALCCRLLSSLTEEMVSEQHREIFRRISYELMLSIYSEYTPPPRTDLDRGVGSLQTAAPSPGMETEQLQHGNAVATGLAFDRVPYFSKARSLEEELLGMQKELEELRAWKAEKRPLLIELEDRLDALSRSKGSADLSAQIALVEKSRAEDKLEKHLKFANEERTDLRRRIELEVEEGHVLRGQCKSLTAQMENMISLDKVDMMKQQLRDFLEVMSDLQREVISTLCKRRDALDVSDSLQEDQNLGALLGADQPLQALTEERNVKGFLEHWVAGKLDPGGEAAAAEAVMDPLNRFGSGCQDGFRMIELINTLSPGSLNVDRVPPASSGEAGGKAARVQGGATVQSFKDSGFAGRARAVSDHVGNMLGGKLVSTTDLQAGGEQALALVAAALFLRFPQIKTHSPLVAKSLDTLKEHTKSISEHVGRLIQLSSNADERPGKQPGQSPVGDDTYFAVRLDAARSFQSVYARTTKLVGEAEEERARLLRRLREERTAWAAVYTNVSNFVVSSLARKFSTVDEALMRLQCCGEDQSKKSLEQPREETPEAPGAMS